MDKRQWLRIDRKITAEVVPIDSKQSGSAAYLDEVWIKDISVNGVGLVARSQYGVGAALKIKFQLPNQKHPLEALGHVIWNHEVASMPKNQYRLGVAFESIQPADRAALLDFVHDDGKTHSMIQKATGGGRS